MTKGTPRAELNESEQDARINAFAQAISHWFLLHQRELPWRKERSPYRVWLSEIMLQQTQVVTVIPYFERFTTRFASVSDLANAEQDEVLSLWSGLGYYARGRNLHRAAQMVRDEFGGIFPSEVSELERLPGVGKYTSRAIAAFAFGKKVALVDGNIARVMSRFFDDECEINTPAGAKRSWGHSQRCVEQSDSAPILNEGLIEFGALLCTPKSPRCESCPVNTLCAGRYRADSLPRKLKKAAKKERSLLALVCVHAGKILVEKRPQSGLFGGLYEPPTEALGHDIEAQALRMLEARQIRAKRIDLSHAKKLTRVLTHRKLHFTVIGIDVEAPAANLFVQRRALQKLGISSSVKAIFESVLDDESIFS